MQADPRPQSEDLDDLEASLSRLEATAEALDARLVEGSARGGTAEGHGRA